MNTDNDDTLGKAAYADLVQLSYLAGCGLTLPVLSARCLRLIATVIPAGELWLWHGQRLVAQHGPTAPAPGAPDLIPHGCLALEVGPGWHGMVRPFPIPRGESVRDACSLAGRMLGLVLTAEGHLGPGGIDDYRTAKDAFQKAWLHRLMERYEGNVSRAAQASGLSRGRLHELKADMEAGR
jgi:hypothetical protein